MNEGAHTIYVVQFFTSNGDRWTAVDVGHILFRDLTFRRAQEPGTTYRALLDPQHDCWQQTGVNGFLNVEDAWAAHDACVAKKTDREFRVARQSWVKMTEPVVR